MTRLIAIVLLIFLHAVAEAAEEPVKEASPADPLIARFCGIEMLAEARVACVGALAGGKLMVLETRFANATSGLQAASGPMLQAFERRLALLHRAWRDEVAVACRYGKPIERETCRLEQILERLDRVDRVIAGAFERVGGPPGVFKLPEELEVKVPVTAPTGETLEIEIPIEIPPS